MISNILYTLQLFCIMMKNEKGIYMFYPREQYKTTDG